MLYKTYDLYIYSQALHKVIGPYFSEAFSVTLPPKFKSMILKPSSAELEERVAGLCNYMFTLLTSLGDVQEEVKRALCTFLEVKQLFEPPSLTLVHAESIPNRFLEMKEQFNIIVSSQSTKKESNDRALMMLKMTWGNEAVVKIFEAHALLQRMATILGLTLEINHFFVSMFGNTLAFSRLPLRDLLLTQKDIMNNFLSTCVVLFKVIIPLGVPTDIPLETPSCLFLLSRPYLLFFISLFIWDCSLLSQANAL